MSLDDPARSARPARCAGGSMRWWARSRLRTTHLHRVLRPGARGADCDAWIHAMGRQPGCRAHAATRTVDDCRGIRRTGEGARRATGDQLASAGERLCPETRHRHVFRSRDLRSRDARLRSPELPEPHRRRPAVDRGRPGRAAGEPAGLAERSRPLVGYSRHLRNRSKPKTPRSPSRRSTASCSSSLRYPVLAPDVIGYLVLGQAIDDGFATELKRATGSDISFLTGDRVFASSWPLTMRDRRLPAPGRAAGIFGLAATGQASCSPPAASDF